MKELWKPLTIQGYEGLYEISNIGRIKSLPRYKHTPHRTFYLSQEKILKQTLINSGYLIVTLSNKPLNESFLVHILTGIH